MIAIVDADSLCHKAFYIVENNENPLEDGLDLILSMEASMFNQVEDELGTITEFHYFFTTCTKNFKKEVLTDYKAGRKERNPMLYQLLDVYMEYVASTANIYYSDTKEADDLLSEFIKVNGLKPTEYCIFNIDKDIDQIEGFHFNYQKVDLKDENNNSIVDEYGKKIKHYKGLEYISKKQAFKNFCKLMLMGDKSDNIYGVKGVGEVTSEKILKNKTIFGMWRTVVEEYLKKETKEKLKTNIKLIRL